MKYKLISSQVESVYSTPEVTEITVFGKTELAPLLL